jgi:hypothetical protein
VFFSQLFHWATKRIIVVSNESVLRVSEISSLFEKVLCSPTQFDMVPSEVSIALAREIKIFMWTQWVYCKEPAYRFAYPDQVYGFEMSGGAPS